MNFKTFAAQQPDAARADVERMFSHLDPEVQGFWWASLGFALRGVPGRRFLAGVGETGGGKTTLINALLNALGSQYASSVPDEAFRGGRTSPGRPNPEEHVFTRPRRLAIADEAKGTALPAKLMKDRTGGGVRSIRDLYSPSHEDHDATATILLFANPETLPRLDLKEQAVGTRFVEIPHGAVPKSAVEAAGGLDYQFRMKNDAARGACMLARLVQASQELGDCKEPPRPPHAVRVATRERRRLEIGEIGDFAPRVVRAPGERLSVQSVWVAFCKTVGVNPSELEAAGIRRQDFSRCLRPLVNGLDAARRTRLSKEGPHAGVARLDAPRRSFGAGRCRGAARARSRPPGGACRSERLVRPGTASDSRRLGSVFLFRPCRWLNVVLGHWCVAGDSLSIWQ